MKKCSLLLLVAIIVFTNVVYAKSKTENKNIGIIIVNSDRFKDDYFYEKAKRIINNKTYVVISDIELQSKYLKYCEDNKIEEDKIPGQKDLVDFMIQNNLDNMICLDVKLTNCNYKIAKDAAIFIKGRAFWVDNSTIDLDIKMTAYFYDKTKLIEKYNEYRFGVASRKLSEMGDDVAKATKEVIRTAEGNAFSSCIRHIRKNTKNLI